MSIHEYRSPSVVQVGGLTRLVRSMEKIQEHRSRHQSCEKNDIPSGFKSLCVAGLVISIFGRSVPNKSFLL